MKLKLSDSFLEKYKKIKPPFGFNGLGEIVYSRTYSRIKEVFPEVQEDLKEPVKTSYIVNIQEVRKLIK